MYDAVLVLRASRVELHPFAGPEALKSFPPAPEVTTILTIYALIGDDMRLIFSEKQADDTFNVITATTMVVFGLEVIINTFGALEKSW